MEPMAETTLSTSSTTSWKQYGLIALKAVAVITLVAIVALGVIGTFFSQTSLFQNLIGTIGYEGSLAFLIGGSIAFVAAIIYCLRAPPPVQQENEIGRTHV